jgi:hypothetical protein
MKIEPNLNLIHLIIAKMLFAPLFIVISYVFAIFFTFIS